MFGDSIKLSVLVGRTLPTPAPPSLMLALRRAEVTISDSGRSGFQLELQVTPLATLPDWDLLASRALDPFNRVVIVVSIGARPTPIMDGLIVRRDLVPGSDGEPHRLIVTGEDLSVAMDIEERSAAYPAMNDSAIVLSVLSKYMTYGLVPRVSPTPISVSNAPAEVAMQQASTDREFVLKLARRHGYVFQIVPGAPPVAYFGPPQRLGVPQPALSIGQVPVTNVLSIRFSYDALAPKKVKGSVQDTLGTDSQVPIQTLAAALAPLAAVPAIVAQRLVRLVLASVPGLDPVQAMSMAQGITDSSADKTLTAEGEVDVLRYQHVLTIPGLVGVRGAGLAHDGLYRITRVTHVITPDSYRQRFVLAREGLGTTVAEVLP